MSNVKNVSTFQKCCESWTWWHFFILFVTCYIFTIFLLVQNHLCLRVFCVSEMHVCILSSAVFCALISMSFSLQCNPTLTHRCTSWIVHHMHLHLMDNIEIPKNQSRIHSLKIINKVVFFRKPSNITHQQLKIIKVGRESVAIERGISLRHYLNLQNATHSILVSNLARNFQFRRSFIKRS